VIVVADASPLRYLILIEYAHVLPAMYGQVVVPPAVVTELTRDRTPDIVKKWLEDKPDWLHVQAPTQTSARIRQDLGEGERQAIELALEMGADALLVDDRDARHEAQKHGVAVLGTLRVLADASEHGFADLAVAFSRLRKTNFRASDQLLDQLLDYAARRPER
jgi:predicted nucleic acid-binding protein